MDTRLDPPTGDPPEAGPAPGGDRVERLSSLAGGLAHEIKNPLSTMALNLTLLQEEWDRAARQRNGERVEATPREQRSARRVKTLQREVARLEQILDEFLAFAREGRVNRSPGDLREIVRAAVEAQASAAESSDLRFEAELPPVPPVRVDPQSLGRALEALLRNAIDAGSADGVLRIELERLPDGVEWRLIDRGVGMDEDHLARCFDEYWSGKTGGTGLGLPMARRIVEEHGGTLELESQVGEGTLVRLRLPLMAEDTHRLGSDRGERGVDDPGRLAFLSRLAGGLSHEIRTPLSTMAINLTLLEEDWSRAAASDTESPEASPREQRTLRRTRTLQREVARLERILEEFLGYARGQKIERRPVDLAKMVHEVLEFVEPEDTSLGIRHHVDLAIGLPTVQVDEAALRQALLNLLVNARQAMPGGGELIVRLGRVGDWIELSVTDTGTGMGEEQMGRCFEEFWSDKKGGTGLGLPTAQRILSDHGGTIRGISELGRGTSFSMWLPLVGGIAGKAAGPPLALTAGAAPGSTSQSEEPPGPGDPEPPRA